MAVLTIAGITEVTIGEGLPSELLPMREGRRQVALITQPAATTRALEIASLLGEAGLSCEVLGVPDRDEAKTLEVAESIYEGLARQGLTRDDTIVGVGGGSVTDLAGFVAGTWLRGVEVVHFPTTLLGAVDASIGGKTGVNLAGKNLVGVIWHPTRVVVDTVQLAQLPSSLLREGMAEAFKVGLIGDPELYEAFTANGQQTPIEYIVEHAVAVKAELVGRDDRERGERAFLNFGHTIGHAIEYASPLSHGESVGLGMIAAAAVSEARLGFAYLDDVRETVGRLGLRTSIGGLDSARVSDLLRHDKKRDEAGLRMVLLSDIAKPKLLHVADSDVKRGLTAVGL